MNIKTAVALSAGIVIGFTFAENDIRVKVLKNVRKRIIHFLGGEERKPNVRYSSPVNYKTSYKEYIKEKEEKEAKPDSYFISSKESDIVKNCLIFTTEEHAEKALETIQSWVSNEISVHSIYMMKGGHVDYTWDGYGWDIEEFSEAFVCPYDTKNNKYRIANVGDPHRIEDSTPEEE